MTRSADRLKRAIGGIYSFAADRFYNRLVVQGAFRLFGGDLNELVLEQGRRASAAADGGPILDMPVGTGFFAVQTARRHTGLVVASDIAEGMVRVAKRTADEAGVPNLAVVRADAHHLPFKDGAFPAILCSNGLQVMPGTDQTLGELARVLAPEGALFVSVVVLPASRPFPVEAAARFPPMFRSGREWQRALARAGLNVSFSMRVRLAYLIEARRV